MRGSPLCAEAHGAAASARDRNFSTRVQKSMRVSGRARRAPGQSRRAVNERFDEGIHRLDQHPVVAAVDVDREQAGPRIDAARASQLHFKVVDQALLIHPRKRVHIVVAEGSGNGGLRLCKSSTARTASPRGDDQQQRKAMQKQSGHSTPAVERKARPASARGAWTRCGAMLGDKLRKSGHHVHAFADHAANAL